MILKNRSVLLLPASLAMFDWLFMFLCLKFSFEAVGNPMDVQVLMVGFSIGLFTGLFSLTPASIGLMEGSMAGCLYLDGR